MKPFRRVAGNLPGTPDKIPATRNMNELNEQAQSVVNKTGLLLLLLLMLPATVQAQFDYTTTNGTITITEYTGPGGDVIIPDTTNGLPVTSIGGYYYYPPLWPAPPFLPPLVSPVPSRIAA